MEEKATESSQGEKIQEETSKIAEEKEPVETAEILIKEHHNRKTRRVMKKEIKKRKKQRKENKRR